MDGRTFFSMSCDGFGAGALDAENHQADNAQRAGPIYQQHGQPSAVGAGEQAMQQAQAEHGEAEIVQRAPDAIADPALQVKADYHESHQVQTDLTQADPERAVGGAGERDEDLVQAVADVAVAQQDQAM